MSDNFSEFDKELAASAEFMELLKDDDFACKSEVERILNKLGWYAKEEDRKDNKRRRGEERLLIDVLNDKA